MSCLEDSQSRDRGVFIKMHGAGGGVKNGSTTLTQESHTEKHFIISFPDVFVIGSGLWEKASPPLYMTFFLIKHLKRRLPPGKRQPIYS